MYYLLLIESRLAIAHIVHRAHLVPFLHTVLRRIYLWKPDKAAASEVQRTDVAAEQRGTLLPATTFYMFVRNAVLASGWGECSHCYLSLFLNSTLYIFYRECVNTSECIRTASIHLLYLEHLSLCYLLPQVEPFAYPAFVFCNSPNALSPHR